MAVWRRPTALGTTLEEDLVTVGRLTRRQHGHVFSDDVESIPVVLGCNDERSYRHPVSPSGQSMAAPAAARNATTTRWGLDRTHSGSPRLSASEARWTARVELARIALCHCALRDAVDERGLCIRVG